MAVLVSAYITFRLSHKAGEVKSWYKAVIIFPKSLTAAYRATSASAENHDPV
jgi:hypothetical protein